MFLVSKPCFLLVPTPSNNRVLKSGRVLDHGDGSVTVEFQEPVAPPAGSEVILLADFRGKFHQQAATVSMHLPDAAQPTVQFQTIGEPVSAESRGMYRVSLITAELFATVGKTSQCPVADVSPEGCAIISNQQLPLGSAITLHFAAEGIIVSGTFRVQCAKPLSPKRTRYGLYMPDKSSPARRALEKLAGTMQRMQLKRLSGAA